MRVPLLPGVLVAACSTGAISDPNPVAPDTQTGLEDGKPAPTDDDPAPTDDEDSAALPEEDVPAEDEDEPTSEAPAEPPLPPYVSSIRAWPRGAALIVDDVGPRVALGLDDRTCFMDARTGALLSEVDTGGTGQSVHGGVGDAVLVRWVDETGQPAYGWSDGDGLAPIPPTDGERIDLWAIQGDDRLDRLEVVIVGDQCLVRFDGEHPVEATVDVDPASCRDVELLDARERSAALRFGDHVVTVTDPFVGSPVVRFHPTVSADRVVAAIFDLTRVVFAHVGMRDVERRNMAFEVTGWSRTVAAPVAGLMPDPQGPDVGLVVAMGAPGTAGTLTRFPNWDQPWASVSLDIPHVGQLDAQGDVVIVEWPGGVDVVDPTTEWEVPWTSSD